jgi:hypothetical protein
VAVTTVNPAAKVDKKQGGKEVLRRGGGSSGGLGKW